MNKYIISSEGKHETPETLCEETMHPPFIDIVKLAVAATVLVAVFSFLALLVF